MLSHSQVTHYMLAKNLISPERVVDCDLRVIEASRRNRNFLALSERGPSYLVKQGIDAGGVETIAHESRIYRFLQGIACNEVRSSSAFFPDFVKYDASRRKFLSSNFCGKRRIFMSITCAMRGSLFPSPPFWARRSACCTVLRLKRSHALQHSHRKTVLLGRLRWIVRKQASWQKRVTQDSKSFV